MPLAQEASRGQSFTLSNNYARESHHGVTSAYFPSKWLENDLKQFPASFRDQASRLLMLEVPGKK